MKRTALARKTPLRNRRPLARRTAIRRVNHQRARTRRARDFGPQAALCRTFACVVCWSGPVEVHHEPPRSCGGRDANTVPLCPACHRERHDIGLRAFNRKHGVDLVHETTVMAEYLAMGMVAA